MHIFKAIGDWLLFLSCPIVLGAGILLTIKTRFVQFRKLPHMFKLLFSMLFKGSKKGGPNTVRAHRALFTAMSTTIGISTIVSPIIAIRLGGPGAIVGFVLATLLGAAVNYTEVTFALSYRKKSADGVAGGPMQYLKDAIHPALAKWYAFFGFLMLMGWSAAQANQLGQILNTPFLGGLSVPVWATGIGLAVLVTAVLFGGIKRVANFSSKLVPTMFLLYVGGALWIIGCNIGQLPHIFQTIISSCFSAQSFSSGIVVGGIAAAFRWGVFKGLHATEAGVGTQTIPHSMAETDDPTEQGILAMISTYSAGLICILSSLVILLTGTWLDNSLSLGINMIAASFHSYFSMAGVVMVIVSAFLFAFGTILGNSFNGSQCFTFLSKNRYLNIYYLATAGLIFFGSVMDVTVVWSMIDYLLVPVVLPHIVSIVYLSYKEEKLLAIAPPQAA